MGPPGAAGGVQQFVLGLAAGLAELEGDGEQYHFLVDWQTQAWLGPVLRGPCFLLVAEGAPRPATSGWKRTVKRIVPRPVMELPFRALAAARAARPFRVPVSDGSIERAGIDVMHQTVQDAFLTNIPTIYTPYDLQHIHLPEMFAPRDLRRKEASYSTFCEAAEAVIAISRWGKEDLIRTLHLPPGKVRVVHLAPAVDTYAELDAPAEEALRRRLGLPASFALYPAQTWPHKNHIRLLEAFARLRDIDALPVPVIFTGHRNDHFPAIARRVRELRLEGQVFFSGFLAPAELKAVYRRARILVFPSRFEGFGMPIVEAFRLGVPVACSNATSLPEVAGDAAEFFDPDDTASMATAIRRLWTDEARRRDLVVRGEERARNFSWTGTARRCRVLYRMVGRRPLDEADQRLLAEML